MTLVVLELMLIAILALLLHHSLGAIMFAGAVDFWRSSLLPFLVFVIIAAMVSVAGVGVATIDPRRYAFVVSYPLLPIYLLFKPLNVLFLKIVSLVFPSLPSEIASPFFIFTAEQPGGEGFIEENGSRLMHSIVEFGVKKVREVMVPRIDVTALDILTPVDEVREIVSDAGHSRVPVYEGSIDRIAGILYVKDLLRTEAGGDASRLERLLREPYFVPEGKKIDDLLREFQLEKKHIAIVVDEYGGTSGIVTLEDILEEIVGEIHDEYDQEGPLIREAGERRYAAAGRISLHDLNDVLGLDLPMDEVDTLAGFLYELSGSVPNEGETLRYEGLTFTVTRLEGQRISEVMIQFPGSGKDGS
jgi:CBS domain containing-hemolysin-like protein